jgi:hypothetical protein
MYVLLFLLFILYFFSRHFQTVRRQVQMVDRSVDDNVIITRAQMNRLKI